MRLHLRTSKRPGTIVPLLAVTIVAVFALVALAVDIGLMALARTHCQNAADVGATSGVRVLTGDASTNNNYAQAAPTARSGATANKILNAAITDGMVNTEVGYYSYDSTAQRFKPYFTGSKPDSESWTAVRVTVKGSQPMFFAKVLGINSLPAEARSTAVHRPRDVAIVLDFSGSMKYSSEPAYPSSGTITGSLNPDPAFPKFGHYSVSSFQNVMQRTTDYIDTGGETHAINNFTMASDNGPAMVRDFLFRDPANGNALTEDAFHRPSSPYDWASRADKWACPAPSDWDVLSGTNAAFGTPLNNTGKCGDPAPRVSKSFTSGNYATTVSRFLQNNDTLSSSSKTTILGPDNGNFDPPTQTPTPYSTADTQGYGRYFKGYTIGPGYYGKTFFYWPPDPRFHPSAVTNSPNTNGLAQDTNGRWMADWRKRFFFNGGTSNPLDGNNSRLWDTTTKQWRQASGTTYAVNYSAILAWIKSGPQVLPPNLRAGRVLYYSAIPDTIPSSGLSQDQLFWKSYIDYVIGNGSATVQRQTGYGRHPDSDSSFGTTKITSNPTGSSDPYMNYTDNPVRPRLQFWFGPLSMLCFLSDNNSSSFARNWMPGTCHESQCWQLKAGVNSALDDIKKNHPNDWVGLIYFSGLQSYTTERVFLGRDYPRMKNALFFPFNTLDNLSDTTYEVRPYNSSFTDTAAGNVPNANGSTSPECGFKLAYNQFSCRTGYNGRRGATKMVIFETDGVPNTRTTATFNNSGAYQSYYSSLTLGANIGNGESSVLTNTKAAAQQICNLDTAASPGYSTARTPVRIHSIAFGDLFETTGATKNMALQFVLDIQKIGGTSASTDTTIESYKIITGTYTTRIDNLRQAFERIMQSGVQVSIIE